MYEGDRLVPLSFWAVARHAVRGIVFGGWHPSFASLQFNSASLATCRTTIVDSMAASPGFESRAVPRPRDARVKAARSCKPRKNGA
jgi:hypothetical protein